MITCIVLPQGASEIQAVKLLVKPLLILVIFEKVYLVKISPIFDGSPLAFGARYQSFLRVC